MQALPCRHHRPGATHFEAGDARPPHSLQSGTHRAATLPAVRRFEAPPSGVSHLRLLPRRAAGSGRGRVTVIRVALDAMGGDDAPRVEVEGAVQALREFPPTFRIQLAGRTHDIEAALKTHGAVDRDRLEIVEAP